MKEINTQDLNQISGGGFALSGIGGGNPGRYTAGNIGISYSPKKDGFGFSYSHNIAHINRVGTFHKPASAMITFTKKMVTSKRLLALCCMCFLSACNSFDTDGLSAKPTSAASKQPDPNCDNFAFSGSGSGCKPIGQGQPKDKQGQRIPL